MKKTVFKKSYYNEPTARWMRILGDFLNYASAAGAVAGAINEDKTLTIVLIICGAAGKAITNGFKTVEYDGSQQSN
jgi:hypothetical protein